MSINLDSVGLNGKERITKISSKRPISIQQSSSIKEASEKIVSTGHRRIPVVSKKGDVVGIITKSDILDAFLRGEHLDEKISEIMTRNPITCSSDDGLDYVLQKFKLSRRGGFPVVGKGLEGMVSERDFVKQLLGKKLGVSVKEVMTTKPFIVDPGISILDCLKSMVNTKYRRLPVVEGNKLVGIVTSEDMLRYIHENDYSMEALDEPLGKLMVPSVLTVEEEDDISVAIKIMETREVGGLLIVDKEKGLKGIVTERDILEIIETS